MAEDQEETQFQSFTGDEVTAALQAAALEDLNKEENQQVFEANDPVNGAAHGSLSLELEIPESDFIEEDLHSRSITDVRHLRTCSECGKQFTSGKALGGHKRACLQKKNTQKPKIKDVVASKLDREQTGTELNVCYVCSQSFRSLKSLYGHMRKHPEREWRGIQPPPLQRENQCISSSVFDDDDYHYRRDDEGRRGNFSYNSAMDLVETFKGWSVKAKRGHRLLVPNAPSVSAEEDEAEAMQQAVSDLMMLARISNQLGRNDFTVTSKKRGVDQVSSVGSGYGLLKVKEKSPETEDNIGKEIEVDAGSQETKNMMCNSEDTWILKDYDDDSEMEIINEMQQQKKKRRLNELDDIDGVEGEPIATTQTYSCPLCNKSFDKHQALGGHVASHNKNKNVNTVKDSSAASTPVASSAADDRNSNNTDSKAMEKDRQVAACEETGESSRVAAAAAAGSDHQCNICNKTFPTGQALGGHKRCHWTGPAEAFSSTSQVTTSAGEVTQRGVLEFDLNDKPPEYYQFHGVEEATAAA